MNDEKYVEEIRKKIIDHKIFTPSYYGDDTSGKNQQGTGNFKVFKSKKNVVTLEFKMIFFLY